MTQQRRATPKSIRTREKIETAARDLFSLNGFERTTVREIGALAGIDPSMIIRYFASKEALFARVAMPNLQMPDLSADDSRVGAGRGLPVLLRSAASNDDAAERLRTIFITQVFPAIARLGPAETAPVRAGLVASQILGLAMARYVLRIPPVVAMAPDLLIRTVGETVQRYATGAAL
jgi:AcrR family transcriptional regulator